MNRIVLAIVFAFSLTCMRQAQAHAETCSHEITKLETLTREPNTQPFAGATDRQTIGAQLHHQPTAASIAGAQHQATDDVDKALAHAKSLDASGQEIDCMNAVQKAKLLLGLE
jgi:uncharacterized membrane protein YccC